MPLANPTFVERLENLNIQVGTDIGGIFKLIADVQGYQGNLADLSTTAKTNFVAAINEIKSQIGSIDLTALIDDNNVKLSGTWSSSKISDFVTTKVSDAVSQVTNGAPEALDTLKELADAFTANGSMIDTVLSALAKRVRVDKEQNFTEVEKAMGRANLGAVSATDFSDHVVAMGYTDAFDPLGAYTRAKTAAQA